MTCRRDILPSDPNFLLNYLEEMPSDDESDKKFDGYITDEDVEGEESSCTAISSSINSKNRTNNHYTTTNQSKNNS